MVEANLVLKPFEQVMCWVMVVLSRVKDCNGRPTEKAVVMGSLIRALKRLLAVGE